MCAHSDFSKLKKYIKTCVNNWEFFMVLGWNPNNFSWLIWEKKEGWSMQSFGLLGQTGCLINMFLFRWTISWGGPCCGGVPGRVRGLHKAELPGLKDELRFSKHVFCSSLLGKCNISFQLGNYFLFGFSKLLLQFCNKITMLTSVFCIKYLFRSTKSMIRTWC
jgi:hypothetical protein